LLSEEVNRYRESEVEVIAKIIHGIITSTDDTDMAYCRGQMDAVRQIINRPLAIASTPEEKIYAKEMIGRTRELLANKIANKYLFEE